MQEVLINEITLILAVALALAVFIMPRKFFLLPFILAACFVPADQRIIIMELDFTVLRIVILAGIIRLVLYGETVPMRLTRFDYLILAWGLVGSIVMTIRWLDAEHAINRLGFLFDLVGLYWIGRQKLRSWDDLRATLRLLAWCGILLAPLVALEWLQGENPFTFLGRVATTIREGRYRCQAAFPHAIMLGLFWATLAPLFVGMFRTEARRGLYFWATAAAIFMVGATASSTPVATLLEILLLLLLFTYRQHGKAIAWLTVFMLVMLHLIREKPVWNLVSRVNLVGGSTGWHRFYLIDQAIRRFKEWALLGTQDTSHWGWGLHDITNEYILQGVRGGFITMILFIIILIWAVKIVGRWSMRPDSWGRQYLAWCLAVSLLGHALSFIGVSYFGQIMLLWYLMLAFVGSMVEAETAPILVREPAYRVDIRTLYPNRA